MESKNHSSCRRHIQSTRHPIQRRVHEIQNSFSHHSNLQIISKIKRTNQAFEVQFQPNSFTHMHFPLFKPPQQYKANAPTILHNQTPTQNHEIKNNGTIDFPSKSKLSSSIQAQNEKHCNLVQKNTTNSAI